MVTIIIIILTAAVSLLCFYGGLDLDKLKFSAHDVWHHRKWWQLVTYGFVHGGWGHLFFNMLTLYFFGRVVEQYFAPLYLLYCWYMARRNADNIGHTAHFWGAVYGLVFPLLLRPDILQHFLHQLGI